MIKTKIVDFMGVKTSKKTETLKFKKNIIFLGACLFSDFKLPIYLNFPISKMFLEYP